MKTLNPKEVANLVEEVLTFGDYYKLESVTLEIDLFGLSQAQINELKEKLGNSFPDMHINRQELTRTLVEHLTIQYYPREVSVMLFTKEGENNDKFSRYSQRYRTN